MKQLCLLAYVFIMTLPVTVVSAQTPENEPASPVDNPPQSRIEYPKLVKFVPAEYPETARKERREGVVLLRVDIDETGKVLKVEVVRPLYPDLDEAAIQAVSQFEFTPALLDIEFNVALELSSLDELRDESPNTNFIFMDMAYYTTCGTLEHWEDRWYCEMALAGSQQITCDPIEPNPVKPRKELQGSCVIHAVIRDNLGGIDWLTQEFLFPSHNQATYAKNR